jgi:hypothetical protein
VASPRVGSVVRWNRVFLSCRPCKCVDTTPEMAWLLAALRSWPVGPEVLEQIQAMAELEQARAWGWVMRTGELTGTGRRHAGEQPRGILPTGL